MRMPESLGEIRDWALAREQQTSVCGSFGNCLVAEWLQAHNPGMDIAVFPDDTRGGRGVVTYSEAGGWPEEDALPDWLDELAVEFDRLDPDAGTGVVRPSYIPTAEEVERLFTEVGG